MTQDPLQACNGLKLLNFGMCFSIQQCILIWYCIFLAGLHFVFEKKYRGQNMEVYTKNATGQSKRKFFCSSFLKIQPKNSGKCFTTKLKSTLQNSATFEGKKFTQKSHLHQSCTKPFKYRLLFTNPVTVFCRFSIPLPKFYRFLSNI